jgi:hypothetical protein
MNQLLKLQLYFISRYRAKKFRHLQLSGATTTTTTTTTTQPFEETSGEVGLLRRTTIFIT